MPYKCDLIKGWHNTYFAEFWIRIHMEINKLIIIVDGPIMINLILVTAN